MKIGIITFHRAHNYGAVLQAYALQEFLKTMGHDVAIIDYRQKVIETIYNVLNLHKLNKLLLTPKALIRYLLGIGIRAWKGKNFNEFLQKYIALTEKCNTKNIPQNQDAYIIGSDQLWSKNSLRVTANSPAEEDPVYMGEFEHTPNAKIITYAVSTNTKSLEMIGKEKLEQYARNFFALSFREAECAERMKAACQRNIQISLDPTLLSDKNIWEPMINKKWENKKYVLYYQLRQDENHVLRNSARKLAKEQNFEFIDFSSTFYPVEDFVSAFKYAQCVITTSFHATVFSLIFEKPFRAIELEDGHDGRYVDLLKRLEADHVLTKNRNLQSLPTSFDYTKINEKLKELRKPSIQYLENALN